ncbi:hypothetical protein ACF0H5_023882 [Mactra antiquata]
MHQFHNQPKASLDIGYKGIGIDTAALKKFGRTCAKTTPCVGIQLKKIREPQLIIIRNKYTKEIVDLETKTSLDIGYKGIGIDTAALKKFGRTCAKTTPCVGIQLKKIREPQLIIIRNKYTKEIVDLESQVMSFETLITKCHVGGLKRFCKRKAPFKLM